MNTQTIPQQTDLSQQTATLYYKDGRIQDALIQSDLLSEKTIRYIPQSPIYDRRKFPRVPFIKEIRLDQLGIRRTTDLSNRGMYIECITPYPLGTILSIILELGKETLCMEVRVAFTDPGIGMGVEFFKTSSSNQLMIEALVQRILKNTNGNFVKCRRKGLDRRKAKKNQDTYFNKLGIRRHTKDRRIKKKKAIPPAEVNLSQIKSIIFPKTITNPHAKGEPVIIEFRDGEEVQATIFDFSPEPLGFFADLYVTEDTRYTLFIVKSAVKHIEYIF